jgi:hypothetical protein
MPPLERQGPPLAVESITLFGPFTLRLTSRQSPRSSVKYKNESIVHRGGLRELHDSDL